MSAAIEKPDPPGPENRRVGSLAKETDPNSVQTSDDLFQFPVDVKRDRRADALLELAEFEEFQKWKLRRRLKELP